MERMGALGCMGRAMVMLELTHGAGIPGTWTVAVARKMAVCMMRYMAAVSPHYSARFWFRFSSNAAHVVPSSDGFTASRIASHACAWARSERGVRAGCGVVRWALQLSKEDGGHVFRVGVASDAFAEHDEAWPKHTWFIQNNFIVADGRQTGEWISPSCFTAGDVVTVELERAPGVDGGCACGWRVKRRGS